LYEPHLGGEGGFSSESSIIGNKSPNRDGKAAAKAIATRKSRGHVSFKGRWDCNNPTPPPDWTGKHHSDQAKAKISSTRKARGCCLGEKNGQFGVKRVGISKDGVIKKVLHAELNEYLNAGWIRGFSAKYK